MSVVGAGCVVPPGQPAGQRAFVQPADIAQRYFPDPDVDYPTPAFSRAQGYTTQDELLAFVERLSRRSPHLHSRELARTQLGRSIPILVFARAPAGDARTLIASGRPTLWIHAQQHGDEPAAGEAALAVAWALTGSLSWVLERINVVIVPRVNPDGAEMHARHLANKMDANRDAMRMLLAESRALRQANLAYRPVATVDVHEYHPARRALARYGKAGLLEAHDMLILGGLNPNIAPAVRDLTDNLLIPSVMRALSVNGLSVNRYYLLRNKRQAGGGKALRAYSGGPAARIGRNYHGLLNQASILLESRGIGLGRTSFKRRVHSHVISIQAIIGIVHEQAGRFVSQTARARHQVIELGRTSDDEDLVVIRADPVQEPLVLPFIDLATSKRRLMPLPLYTYEQVTPRLVRQRPAAYLIRAGHELAVDTLRDLGVQVERIDEARLVSVQAFTVTNFDADGKVYEGAKRRRGITTRQSERLVRLPAGSYVVPMDQPLAGLAVEALEPEGADSFATFGLIPAQPGRDLPVYRIMYPLSQS